ncbi:exonuclease SbcCD subunit D [Ethanoligenens harbinense]|uniref:Nuclease SbcCD subunit D n=1 Tax=Ethanoligenens harbinense (strain DSM 18485 / JCM 12961 / CGMCC 1.5033 / YUAN-3) TaxID=663278 RepID=E6U7K8_ETHHY|nr:exonuclease SbcCD subunit D [Ethanoligenens harbinense]ADU27031.1 nuclease SbcCD, D subunit [Ethanoligenens harbinense YUAN-3]AVQ96117.1 exonuclease SbcCD subunit D [Ethanoligenens harbinense YUAN-3]AYF38778.1 exonuclease SbcCD subunit D [Ethanoligenens harbinense]AYF41526.1 exonuclease SbcCD subunit D [Ethanoligenens harbinense]QCN92358.1 exonuclease SbcCD subunit D [Ethanoligenens harbinense]
MRFLHTADLHLGKRVGEFSLIEDQTYLLNQILEIADHEQPDGVLLAGDIYDKSVPSGEAVEVFDAFLTALAERGLPVFLISGNHDSPERLGFGSRIFREKQVHIAGVFGGAPQKITLTDAYGPVHVFLLPFLKPASAAPFFPDDPPESYTDAVRAALAACAPDPSARNVLVAHQFVTAGSTEPARCDSETISVGGLDNVDASVFDAFDYVALGHLHGPQRIGRDSVRYAGSPLKYSFSEARQHKSVTLVELAEKGNVSFRLLPLSPLRDMREICGPLAELLRAGAPTQDYIHATLTDREDVYDAAARLRQVYPNLMRLDFEHDALPNTPSKTAASDVARKSPFTLFAEFFESQNGAPLSEAERALLGDVLRETEGT